ncbi:MAG TPA: carbohydrate ABC transporter permease [Spirochaetia bacterium]|nr:carbohydrate ABC transporter permease [Spirochaetia bacterium]
MRNVSHAVRKEPFLGHLILWLAVLVTVLPMLVTLLTSLKYTRDIISGSLFFQPTLGNYASLFTGQGGDFLHLLLNSVIASVGSTAIVIIISSLAAYSISRFKWPRWVSGVIVSWLLFAQMLPPIVFVGPFYLMSRTLGVYNTPVALVMAYIVLDFPLAMFILRRFFADVPSEIEDAALIDGASHATTFLRIIVPIVSPGITAAALLSFVFSWNDFIFALSLTSSSSGMTIPVGIANFAQEYQILYGEMTSAAFFAAIPAIILVVFAQRYITTGLALGSVKG